MPLYEIINRTAVPAPWAEGEKIPWNEPGFSARMLKEHLSQAHDMASRRSPKIEAHVTWIHQFVLGERPARVLDLGCGPGLYTHRLAQLGHTCIGIDFSPASIAYAAANAADQAGGVRLPCVYRQEDIRRAEYGDGFDLVMLIFGEFNTFCLADAALILRKARAALAPGSCLLLEVHTEELVEQVGRQGSSWYSSRSGLFSDRPHLVLNEYFWDAEAKTATTRYYIIEASGPSVTRFAETLQAYRLEEYTRLLAEVGFPQVQVFPSLTGQEDPSQAGLMAIIASDGCRQSSLRKSE